MPRIISNLQFYAKNPELFFAPILGITAGMLPAGLCRMKARRIISGWQSTTGTVTETTDRTVYQSRSLKKHQYLDLKYTFECDGRTQTGQGTLRNGTYVNGNNISVRYDPNDPGLNLCKGEIEQKQLHQEGSNLPLILGIAGMAGLMIFILFIMSQPEKLGLFAAISLLTFLFGFIISIIEGVKLMNRIRRRKR